MTTDDARILAGITDVHSNEDAIHLAWRGTGRDALIFRNFGRCVQSGLTAMLKIKH